MAEAKPESECSLGQPLVYFKTNRYSIPVTVNEDKFTLKAFVDRVEIFSGQQVVAVHRRLLL